MEQIRRFIAQDRVSEALDRLQERATTETHRTDVTQLRGRFASLERAERLGTISFDEARRERARITQAILEMVSAWEREWQSPPDPGPDTSPDEPALPGATRILFLAANPTDAARLRLDHELREIREGLRRARHRDQFALISYQAVQPRDLSRAMLDEEPHIVHFSGHGFREMLDAEVGEDGVRSLVWDTEATPGYRGGIALVNAQGQTQLVEAAALAGLFALYDGQIRCVVLNACYSDTQAEAILQHVPYVIGMTTAIPDATAIAFATGFYDALGAGRDVPFAFNLARNRIQLEGLEGATIPRLLRRDARGG